MSEESIAHDYTCMYVYHQMRRQGISIERINPPSVLEVSKVYMENALKSLKTVDKESLEFALPYAKEVCEYRLFYLL